MHLKGLNSKIFRGRPPGPPAVGPSGGFAPNTPALPTKAHPLKITQNRAWVRAVTGSGPGYVKVRGETQRRIILQEELIISHIFILHTIVRSYTHLHSDTTHYSPHFHLDIVSTVSTHITLIIPSSLSLSFFLIQFLMPMIYIQC